MNKHWMIAPAFLFLAACGAAEDDTIEHFLADEGSAEESVLDEEAWSAEEELELGTVEQALGEAACGTNAVNRAVNFTGRAVRFTINPPYGSATCTNAFLTGLSSSTPRKGTVSIIGQLNVAQAQCSQARLKSDYYVNGATVVPQLSSAGVFRNGNCLVSTTYRFNPAVTSTTVSGTTANIAGGTPALAANARFAAQALNNLGAIQKFTWEINP
jgi:hypothetical protein